MEALSSRPYEGSGDLRRIQQLMVDDADWTAWHIGDLAWAMREHGHLELSLYIHLYLAGPRVVGWTFVRGRGFIDLHLHPAHRHAEAYAAMLATAEATIDATTRAGDPVTGYGVWFWEGDAALVEAARQRGYAPKGDGLQVNRRSLEELPVARDLPAGWTTGAVDTEARLASRVECHRAAFAPSTLTVATYRRAMATCRRAALCLPPAKAPKTRLTHVAEDLAATGAERLRGVEHRSSRRIDRGRCWRRCVVIKPEQGAEGA